MSFLAPAFLLGLAALAAPILAHMVQRYKAPKMPFPSLRFLHATPLPRKGGLRLRDLLLLLLRMLIYAAVILALAQPFLPDDDKSISSGGSVGVLVLDTSASMFKKGVPQKVQAGLESFLKEHSEVGLIGFDHEVHTFIEPGKNKDKITKKVRELFKKPSFFKGNPQAALQVLHQLQEREGGIQTTIISDFQASNWVEAELKPLTGPVRLIDSSTRSENNLELSAGSLYSGKDGLKLFVRLRNHSTESVKARLRLNNNLIETFQIDAQSSKGLFLKETLPRSTHEAGRLELDFEDDYKADNIWHLWLGTPPAIQVGLLNVASPESPEDKSTPPEDQSFMEKALKAGARGPHQHFEVKKLQIPPSPITQAFYLGAQQYKSLQPNQLSSLKEFVQSGGLLWLGVPSKNASSPPLQSLGLQGILMGETRTQRTTTKEPYRINKIHKDLKDLLQAETIKDLYLAQIHRYKQLKAPVGARILLQSDLGEPLLMSVKYGDGVFLVCAFDFRVSSTDLPLRTSFVPLIQEIFSMQNTAKAKVQNLLPSDNRLGELNLALGQPIATKIEGIPIQVNTSRIESSQEKMNVQSIQRSLNPIEDIKNQKPNTAKVGQKNLWQILAWLALAAFVGESFTVFLANRKQARSQD